MLSLASEVPACDGLEGAVVREVSVLHAAPDGPDLDAALLDGGRDAERPREEGERLKLKVPLAASV
jgi:hypothetical protein